MDTLTIAYNSSNEPTILVGKSETFSAHLACYRKLITEGSSEFVRVEVWRSKRGRVKNKLVPEKEEAPKEEAPKEIKPTAKKSPNKQGKTK